ncbi:MAG TPA: hypothetical protein GX690_03570, partial [Tenericutes bacterium]|nr:hypothetical protein [Mycoplasmatota bacterium]
IKYLIYNYARYLNLDEVEIYKKYKEEAFKHPFKHQEEQEEIKKKRHSNEFYEKDISSPVAPLIKTKKTLPFSNFLLIGIIIFVVLLIFYLLVSFFRKDYFEKENKNEYYISFNYEVKGRI